jgi:hypothetical protein
LLAGKQTLKHNVLHFAVPIALLDGHERQIAEWIAPVVFLGVQRYRLAEGQAGMPGTPERSLPILDCDGPLVDTAGPEYVAGHLDKFAVGLNDRP